jgi:hypothetical protein
MKKHEPEIASLEELIVPSPYRDVRRESIEKRSQEARRTAAYILEVLGGGLRPQEAADALNISVPRYYKLEERAVRGLAAACEPMPVGPLPKPELEIAKLRKQCSELEKELIRYQALSRAAHRAIGFEIERKKGTSVKGRKGRPRRPAVRALRASSRLKGAAQNKKAEKVNPPHTEHPSE